MNGFNLSDIIDAKLGAATLSGGIYLGSTKLWPTHDYSQDYFTIESLADNNTITWTFTGSDPIQNVIYWSKNGTSWTSAIASESNTPVSLATLNKGEKMYLKGENVKYASSTSRYSHFNSDAEFNISGNIMSLIYGDNFIGQTTLSSSYNFAYIFKSSKVVDASNLILPATTLTNFCYRSMFSGCTSLSTAPVLPATTLASSCYSNMFNGCTSLTAAPVLPATTLTGTYCYSNMFNGCTSLATAPVLPATTLASSCYSNMFNGCTSLTAAPELPATTLASSCYSYMFYGCTSLATAPVLPATTLANSCYAYMFEGCSSLATAPELPATTLANSCYMSMFAGTKITAAPELPATILTDSCYRNMFYGCASLRYPPTLNATILQPRCYQHMFFGCASLKTAPELPATTLTTYCYAYMFQNCTSLSYIKCLATNISASNSHDWWLYNVASTGTFTKKASMMSWPANAHGIPSGWTVVNV